MQIRYLNTSLSIIQITLPKEQMQRHMQRPSMTEISPATLLMYTLMIPRLIRQLHSTEALGMSALTTEVVFSEFATTTIPLALRCVCRQGIITKKRSRTLFRSARCWWRSLELTQIMWYPTMMCGRRIALLQSGQKVTGTVSSSWSVQKRQLQL